MSGPDEGAPPPADPHQEWTPPGSHPTPGGQAPRGQAPRGQAPGGQAPVGPPWGQAGGPPPGHGGRWAPAGPVHGAAHKPGAVPLRPLELGDLYDAAFTIIRHNPKATVGSAALVAAAAMAVPVLITLVVAALVDVDGGMIRTLTDPSASPSVDPDDVTGGEVAGLAAGFGSLMLGSILQWLGLVLVTGMIAHVTMAAALGRTMGLGEAWAATRGRRARLVGLVLVLGLLPFVAILAYVGLWVVAVVTAPTAAVVVFGVVTVPLFLVLLVVYWVRVQYLAVPPLMLEGTGIRGSLGRAFRLSHQQFWRLFGIALLTGVITFIAGTIVAFPVSVAQQILVATVENAQALLVVHVVGQALATVLSSAFVTPFSAGVASLLYLDQRIRKEGFDVELLSAAGRSAGDPAGPPPGSR